MLHTQTTFQLLLTVHLIGLALGLGAVGVSDFAFFRAMHKGDRITPETVSWMRFFSKIVWLGLVILALSGIGLFLFNPQEYLSSPGFLAKMVIVGILTINGLVLNLYITASLTTYSFSTKYKRSNTTWRARKLAFICGAISGTSWYSALFAAMFKSFVKFTFWQFMAIYGIALMGAIASALIMDQVLYRYMTKKYSSSTSTTPLQNISANSVPPAAPSPLPMGMGASPQLRSQPATVYTAPLRPADASIQDDKTTT
jgi:hypothetical protein